MLRDPKTNDLVHTVCIDDKSKLNINNPNLVTADGVQLNLRYKFIYQIEGKEGLYPEVFEYSRLGSEIIKDITSFDKFFRHNKGVDLSSGEHPLSQLRHFLIGKLIVITHTKIKGKGSKVIKSIRKQTGLSTKEINEILKMKKCKKSVETLKSVIGAYMFFKITRDNLDKNCFTVTDRESMTRNEAIEMFEHDHSEGSQKWFREKDKEEKIQILMRGVLGTVETWFDFDQSIQSTIH